MNAFPGTSFLIGTQEEWRVRLRILEHFPPQSSFNFVTILAIHITGLLVLARCPSDCVRQQALCVLTDILTSCCCWTHCMILQSCSNDVGDLGVAEQEERVDKTLDIEWHEVCNISMDLLPFFVRCGN